MSRAAYAAYLIHEPVIIALAYLLIPLWVYPLLKWVGASLVAVPLCFALGALLRRPPGADRVL